MNNPLEGTLDYAERIYIRMEAEHVIRQCLQRGEIVQFTQLIEELVLAGQPAFGVMREILEEIRSFRAGMSEERITLRQELDHALQELGMDPSQRMNPEDLDHRRKSLACEPGLHLEQQAGENEHESDRILTEIFFETSDQLKLLAGQLGVLASLEAELRDWYQGMAYQILHHGNAPSDDTAKPVLH